MEQPDKHSTLCLKNAPTLKRVQLKIIWIIKIDTYNFEHYRFKFGAFFSGGDTSHSQLPRLRRLIVRYDTIEEFNVDSKAE